MKKISSILLLLAGLACYSQEGKLYIPPENLVIDKSGIFLNQDHSLRAISSISYDYLAERFYIEKRERVLVTCPTCGEKTYDPEHEICFNPKCYRAWLK